MTKLWTPTRRPLLPHQPQMQHLRQQRHHGAFPIHGGKRCCCCPEAWNVTLSGVALDTTCYPGGINDSKAFALSGINGTYQITNTNYPCDCDDQDSGGSLITAFTGLQAYGYLAAPCSGGPDFEFRSDELAITLQVRRFRNDDDPEEYTNCMVSSLLIQMHSFTELSNPGWTGEWNYPSFFFRADGPSGGAFALDTPTTSYDPATAATVTVSIAP